MHTALSHRRCHVTSSHDEIDPDDAAELDAWRDAVRGATGAVGIIELPSTRYVELSRRARELVGMESTTGLDVLDTSERDAAAAVADAATSGAIDGTEVRRRQWRRADGSVVEVTVRSRAIRLAVASFGLWVARDMSSSSVDPLAGPPSVAIDAQAVRRSVTVTLDSRWRVRELIGEAAEPLRDVLSPGVALSAVTDPDDLAALLFAFAGATTRGDASVTVRLRTADGPIVVDVNINRLQDGSWGLTFTSVHRRQLGLSGPRRATDLAGALLQIATELQEVASDAGRMGGHDVLSIPGVRELPQRQREIVVRLSRGERVSTIAAEMYLSANTIRNHLSVVFRRFEVHSQAELLAALRGHDSDGPSNAM
ncbi:MAG: hypothetical protein V7636_391 [Actinomycetota bacterium]